MTPIPFLAALLAILVAASAARPQATAPIIDPSQLDPPQPAQLEPQSDPDSEPSPDINPDINPDISPDVSPDASPAPGPDPQSAHHRIANLNARLTALQGADARPYFLLAEEVAAEAIDPDGVALARQLLLSAYHLESAADQPRQDLLASICLLTAELERVEGTAAWLRALAGALDPRHAEIDWNVSAAPPITSEAALGAARAISLTLAGEGIEAATLLARPDIRAVLRRYEGLLSVTGLPGGLSRLERYARLWPCRECRNQRWITRVMSDGPETVICPTCRGNPGPQVAEEEYIALLRFQARLLDGMQRSWAAEIITSAGAPLLDPDPADFLRVTSQRYGLDPAAVVHEDGAWTRRNGR